MKTLPPAARSGIHEHPQLRTLIADCFHIQSTSGRIPSPTSLWTPSVPAADLRRMAESHGELHSSVRRPPPLHIPAPSSIAQSFTPNVHVLFMPLVTDLDLHLAIGNLLNLEMLYISVDGYFMFRDLSSSVCLTCLKSDLDLARLTLKCFSL